MKKNAFNTIIVSLVIAFSLFGCVEHRYYHKNNRHSEKYEHRHHHNGPEHQVDIEIRH